MTLRCFHFFFEEENFIGEWVSCVAIAAINQKRQSSERDGSALVVESCPTRRTLYKGVGLWDRD